jgi:hypothetical protein
MAVFIQRLTYLGGLLATAWLASTAPVHADVSPSPITLNPTITLSVTSGLPGTAVTITGTEFPPLEIVALYIDQPGPYLDAPGPRADATGAFHKDINMPSSNYDSSGRINPTIPGQHDICGDTAYPGSTQPLPARACAKFQVLAEPSTPAANSPTASGGASVPELLGAFAVVVVVAIGAILWMRRSQ